MKKLILIVGASSLLMGCGSQNLAPLEDKTTELRDDNHQLKLDIHEGPLLSQNSSDELKINNCVTIEPGIYIEGLGGVRIEDDILITENGCHVFTKCSKDLIILE